MQSDKMLYIIYADIEAIIKKKIKKTNGRANNPGKSSTSKLDEHIPCGYSIGTIWEFYNIENKHTSYRGKIV